MRSPRGAARLLVPILAAITQAAACTIVYVPTPVGPSFQVHVTDRGRPVANLRLELTAKSYHKALETGPNGTAEFHNIPPGTYQLNPGPNLNPGNQELVTVTPNGPSGVTIPITWPGQPPLQVQSLKGVVGWPTEPPGSQPSKLQLELLHPRTGNPLQSTQTNTEGGFNLKTPSAGLYFLRVTRDGDASPAGTIPVEIDPRAAARELELDLGESSCGFYFTAHHACLHPELSITTLSGQVIDPTGAPIGPAAVTLFRPDRQIAEQLFTDKQGRFTSQTTLEGNYQLMVTAPGFTPARQTVHATRTPQATPLRIQLGIMGACSQANVQ